MSDADDKKPTPPEDGEESTVFSPGAMPGGHDDERTRFIAPEGMPASASTSTSSAPAAPAGGFIAPR
jgi:hypothetical protein